jgi:hypothetical protein
MQQESANESRGHMGGLPFRTIHVPLVLLIVLFALSGISAGITLPSNQIAAKIDQSMTPTPVQAALNDEERELMKQNIIEPRVIG